MTQPIGNWHPLPEQARHTRQEREANRFAIELLLPRHRLRRVCPRQPNLEAVLWMSGEFDVSKEAAARHYSEVHDAPIAIALSRMIDFVIGRRDRAFHRRPWHATCPCAYLPPPDAGNGGLAVSKTVTPVVG